MTMNSRWRSLFFNFTNAPATGFPDASCTTPSMAELFSAARANWPERHSKRAAKMAVKVDRVRLDFIPDLLISLSLCVNSEHAINAAPARMCNGKHSECVYGPDYSRSIRQFSSSTLTIFEWAVKEGD